MTLQIVPEDMIINIINDIIPKLKNERDQLFFEILKVKYSIDKDDDYVLSYIRKWNRYDKNESCVNANTSNSMDVKDNTVNMNTRDVYNDNDDDYYNSDEENGKNKKEQKQEQKEAQDKEQDKEIETENNNIESNNKKEDNNENETTGKCDYDYCTLRKNEKIVLTKKSDHDTYVNMNDDYFEHCANEHDLLNKENCIIASEYLYDRMVMYFYKKYKCFSAHYYRDEYILAKKWFAKFDNKSSKNLTICDRIDKMLKTTVFNYDIHIEDDILLVYAVKSECVDLVRTLIEKYDFNFNCHNGMPLKVALENRDVDMIKYLFQYMIKYLFQQGSSISIEQISGVITLN